MRLERQKLALYHCDTLSKHCNHVYSDDLATDGSGHNQTSSWADCRNPGDREWTQQSKISINRQEREGDRGRIEDINFSGSEDRKLDSRFESSCIEGEFEGMWSTKKNIYSRHSRTLAPGTALIVWLDVRLHPILHHTANRACHHISAPVPAKSHTQAGKRKWKMSNCEPAAGFQRSLQSGVDTNGALYTLAQSVYTLGLCFVSTQKEERFGKKIIIKHLVTCWLWGSAVRWDEINISSPRTSLLFWTTLKRNWVQMSDQLRITASYQQWLPLYCLANSKPTDPHKDTHTSTHVYTALEICWSRLFQQHSK